jgi:CheY-like chemotaxis protein
VTIFGLRQFAHVAEAKNWSPLAEWRRALFFQYSVTRMDMARTQCRSVLLVEDNEIDAYLTCNVLQKCSSDIAVDLVSTAEEALTQIGKKAYDLIVCDFCLPGMDGLSFLKLVKKVRSNVRIVLLTGYPSQELEAQVIHHGSCTYLSKAVEAETLMRIIIEALELQEPAVSTRSSPTTVRTYLC